MNDNKMALKNIRSILIIRYYVNFIFYCSITQFNHLGLDFVHLFHLIIEYNFVRLE